MTADKQSPRNDLSTATPLWREFARRKLYDLTPREQKILRMRFGLDDGQSYTLRGVGEAFGITRERVRQIIKKSINRLRHNLSRKDALPVKEIERLFEDESLSDEQAERIRNDLYELADIALEAFREKQQKRNQAKQW